MKVCISISLFAIVVLAGCASSPPETHDYLLRPQISTTNYDTEPTIALDKIEIAPYLGYKGIVLETSPGQVDTATHHRWADPLDFSIRRYLQVALMQETGQNVASTFDSTDTVTKRVDVSIHQLHGSVTGRVKLVAEWQITSADADDATTNGQYSGSETIAGDGYGEIVKAHADLLDHLASSIAAELKTSD
jgi:uncharacterized lipoprotein YmbA